MQSLVSQCSSFIAIHFHKGSGREIPLLPCVFTSHRKAKLFLFFFFGVFSNHSTVLYLAAVGVLLAFFQLRFWLLLNNDLWHAFFWNADLLGSLEEVVL